ncbi:MAG: HsmA family protein [Propionicimonas sp.]|uniref:HsmA family protein n=1 Tax=Propionicimonas sp. TaxID=1955623 RepID=UPI003D0B99BE
MFVAALVTINLALVFYSVGVWGERIQRVLKPWHVALFGLGLLCDATGTLLMTRIASANQAAGIPVGFAQTVMAWTGTAAIALMAVHLAWAIVVLVRKRPSELAGFHRFSVVVWAIWLVPYFAGAIASMTA